MDVYGATAHKLGQASLVSHLAFFHLPDVSPLISSPMHLQLFFFSSNLANADSIGHVPFNVLRQRIFFQYLENICPISLALGTAVLVNTERFKIRFSTFQVGTE